MTSLRRPWRLAVRWWTPGSAWLSCRAFPSPQSGRSSPVGPLCIQAARLQWLRHRTRPPPEQTADNYHVSVNMQFCVLMDKNRTWQATLSSHLWFVFTLPADNQWLVYLSSCIRNSWYSTWSCFPHITCRGAVIRCKCSCKAYLEFSVKISINTAWQSGESVNYVMCIAHFCYISSKLYIQLNQPSW